MPIIEQDDDYRKIMSLAGVQNAPKAKPPAAKPAKPAPDAAQLQAEAVEQESYESAFEALGSELGADDGESLGLDEHLAVDTPVALTESPAVEHGRVKRVRFDAAGAPRYLVRHSDEDLREFDAWYGADEIGAVAENRLTKEKYFDTDYMTNDLAGGMHRPHRQHRFGVPGDNPLAAEYQRKGASARDKKTGRKDARKALQEEFKDVLRII